MFSGGGEFQRELRQRVAAELTPERLRRGVLQMAVKGAVLTLWTAGSYLALLIAHGPLAVPLAISLGLALAGVAFCVGHDANHGSLSTSRRINRLLGLSFDVLGASSYVWRAKHNHAHHSYTNVVGADNDIDQMPLARFAPDQQRRWFHRWQHVYMWPLYGLFAIRHYFFGDLRALTGGSFGEGSRIRRVRGWDAVIFVSGKAVFFGWALVLPMFFHTWWHVVAAFVGVSWVMGFTLAVVFQLAHCVDEAHFSSVNELRSGDPRNWAIHQVETTVDFATGNRLLTWYLGGLNFQVEHHLFPKVCHVHYSRILPVVREVCAKHGVRHMTQPTVPAALASHVCWLRVMGRAETTPASTAASVSVT
jgi:linoleoyl-CoA desaturase